MLALTPYGRKCLASFIDNCTDGNNGVYMDCIENAYELAGLYLLRYKPDELPKELERAYVNSSKDNFLILKGEIKANITYNQLAEEIKKCYITDMELLAILENFRIGNTSASVDFAICLCCSFIAQFFGYDNRKDWTGILSSQKLVDYTASSEEARKKYKELAEKLGYKSSN